MNQEAIMSKQKMEVCTGQIQNIYRRAMKIKQLNYKMMKMMPKLCT